MDKANEDRSFFYASMNLLMIVLVLIGVGALPAMAIVFTTMLIGASIARLRSK